MVGACDRLHEAAGVHHRQSRGEEQPFQVPANTPPRGVGRSAWRGKGGVRGRPGREAGCGWSGVSACVPNRCETAILWRADVGRLAGLRPRVAMASTHAHTWAGHLATHCWWEEAKASASLNRGVT
eukprot:scaffold9042_cov112-Isochrysis_galbana.AAC.3